MKEANKIYVLAGQPNLEEEVFEMIKDLKNSLNWPTKFQNMNCAVLKWKYQSPATQKKDVYQCYQ